MREMRLGSKGKVVRNVKFSVDFFGGESIRGPGLRFVVGNERLVPVSRRR